jgi:DHA1 family inner membrane transport protein
MSLLALALAAFTIGTSEFIIVGLLPNLAGDLAVSIPRAGLLVTAYALGVVVGAPIMAMATARMPRKAALLALIVAYAIGNVLCALAPSYAALLAARVLTAVCHGAFFGIGSIVAAELVAPNKRGQAIAIMFSGLTLANVLGVPAGTALGQYAGWRAAFWCVVAIAVVATIAMAVKLPRLARPQSDGLLKEFRVLRKPQVILAMLMSGLLSAGLFSVFTFISPMLERVTHLAPAAVTWLLVLFGVGITAGNLIGGRLGDWRLMPSIAGGQVGQAAILVILTLTMPFALPASLTVLAWGVLMFTAAAPLQMRVVDTAPEAPNLVATLNQGAFNLGNAGGAWIGSAALSAGLTYRELPWLGAALSVAAAAMTALSVVLDRRARPVAAPAGAAAPPGPSPRRPAPAFPPAADPGRTRRIRAPWRPRPAGAEDTTDAPSPSPGRSPSPSVCRARG